VQKNNKISLTQRPQTKKLKLLKSPQTTKDGLRPQTTNMGSAPQQTKGVADKNVGKHKKKIKKNSNPTRVARRLC
jgi:hypothetical protein